MRLQQLRGRCRLVVELGDVAIALRIVIVRVDHDLAGERLDGNRLVVLERHGDDNDVAGGGGIDNRPRSRARAELRHQRGKRVRSA